ncbi:tyrosine-type recombinase/integrase [Paenibacillus sp. Cedars]|uniref:tyrosine-type recombinase/integrase n=1 Tax=Paenibacillus sp. Cedars TaxID=1980674 RepID=UPI0034628885
MRRGEFEYGDGYENNDLVCCYPNGGYIKPKRIAEGMDVLVRKAEVKKIRFHDLRHTHASFLLRIGINPKVAAERLGMTQQCSMNDTLTCSLLCKMKPSIRLKQSLKSTLKRR